MISREAARRQRAYRRAAYAWTHGKPHTAWEILAASGYSDQWRDFEKEAFRHARRTFKVRMARA